MKVAPLLDADGSVAGYHLGVEAVGANMLYTVQDGDGLSATIGPTNRDERGRPVGSLLAKSGYGRGLASPSTHEPAYERK